MSERSVRVTVRAWTVAEPRATFDVVVPIDLTLIFTGYGPLPAVTDIRDPSGPWDHVGATRIPVLSDGTTAREAITIYQPPARFAYEVGRFTNVLARFVHGARGSFTFTFAAAQRDRQGGAGTTIEWVYVFRPRRLCSLAVRLFVAPLWRRYMRQALALIVAEVNRGGAVGP
ncbi:MAG: SRPBCC family protein [Nocardioides sp.]